MAERFAMPIYEGILNGVAVGRDIVDLDRDCRMMMTLQVREMLERSLEATDRLLSLSLTRLQLMNQDKEKAIKVRYLLSVISATGPISQGVFRRVSSCRMNSGRGSIMSSTIF